ncbi:MAG: hypothetical protein R3C15_12995 [Thermoleophilia bacterium]
MRGLVEPCAGERVGRLGLRVELIEQREQVGADEVADRTRLGVVAHREAARAQARAQGGQAGPPRRGTLLGAGLAQRLDLVGRRPLDVRAALGLWHGLEPGRVAHVEERVPGHRRVVEHAVEDLELRDRAAVVVGEPGLSRAQVARDLVGHPAVPLAEQPEEERPAALDLREADRQHRALGLLLVRDAPAEVDLAPGDAPPLARGADLREHALDELLALRLHVAERRGDEDAHGALVGHAGMLRT